MDVLIAGECSGIVRDAFINKGFNAVSCDYYPTEKPGPHIRADFRPVLRDRWDLIIAHPDCTRLCNSGVRWLWERDLWADMKQGAENFVLCLEGNAPHVGVENPVMHKYAREIVGRGPDFTVQPWQFGDNVKKRTCFWVEDLPTLFPTSNLDGSMALPSVHYESPGPNRAKNRSRMFPGLANALADQWGRYIFEAKD